MGTYLEQVWAGMSWAEKKVFSAAAKALGHTKETLADDEDTVVMLRKIAGEAGKALSSDVAEQVGEALYDDAHENCDDVDGCTGGGALWYRKVAARLVDPGGPLAAVAVAQEIAREDTDNPDGRETLDNAAWLGLIATHFGSLRRGISTAKGKDEIRRRLTDLAALAVEWLGDLDKPGPAPTSPTQDEKG